MSQPVYADDLTKLLEQYGPRSILLLNPGSTELCKAYLKAHPDCRLVHRAQPRAGAGKCQEPVSGFRQADPHRLSAEYATAAPFPGLQLGGSHTDALSPDAAQLARQAWNRSHRAL